METQFFKIPKERIAVVIGPKGSLKAGIQKKTKTRLAIDSKTGEVEVTGKGTDLQTLQAVNVVKAIGRGFSPEHAFRLLDEDYYLELIDLEEMFGRQKKRIEMRKGRVIGRNGAMRKALEGDTNVLVSVFGKTIALIGKIDDLETAKIAIQMLLEGKPHKLVYRYLDKATTEQPREGLEL